MLPAYPALAVLEPLATTSHAPESPVLTRSLRLVALLLAALATSFLAGCQYTNGYEDRPPTLDEFLGLDEEEGDDDTAGGGELVGVMTMTIWQGDPGGNEVCTSTYNVSAESIEIEDCNNCTAMWYVTPTVADDACELAGAIEVPSHRFGLGRSRSEGEFQWDTSDYPWVGYTDWTPNGSRPIEWFWFGGGYDWSDESFGQEELGMQGRWSYSVGSNQSLTASMYVGVR